MTIQVSTFSENAGELFADGELFGQVVYVTDSSLSTSERPQVRSRSDGALSSNDQRCSINHYEEILGETLFTTFPSPSFISRPISDDSTNSTSSSSFHSIDVGSSQEEIIDEDANVATAKRERKKVTFGFLEMRNYPMILGDHPDCLSGPPVTIGWDYEATDKIPIDDYESDRKSRRHTTELRLGWSARKRMLRREAEVTPEEIYEAVSEAQRIRKQRSRTIASIRLQHKAEKFCHNCSRRLMESLHPSSRSKEHCHESSLVSASLHHAKKCSC